MLDNALKDLVTTSIKLLEVEEDDELEVELRNYELSEVKYDFLNFINDIGKDNFKEYYLGTIDFIKSSKLSDQRDLCLDILHKLESIYGIFFYENTTIQSKTDIDNIYDFLKFIEFDHVEFISSIWKFLNVDFIRINIEDFCLKNSNKIINEIVDQLEIYILPKIVNIFFRTNIKSVIINNFIKMSKRSRIWIILELEGEK